MIHCNDFFKFKLFGMIEHNRLTKVTIDNFPSKYSRLIFSKVIKKPTIPTKLDKPCGMMDQNQQNSYVDFFKV